MLKKVTSAKAHYIYDGLDELDRVIMLLQAIREPLYIADEDGNVYETKKIKEIIVTVQIEGEFNQIKLNKGE